MSSKNGGMRPIQAVLSKLESRNLKPRSGGGWTASCPCPRHANGDRKNSLAVDEGEDGKAILKCFADGDIESIVYALGLELQDLFADEPSPSNGGGKTKKPLCIPSPKSSRVKVADGFTEKTQALVAAYDYTDSAGTLLYQNCRYKGLDGKKDFKARKPNGSGGWEYRLNGVQRVLYRLPDVIEAVALERTVYIVEGEKDVERLRSFGLTATTSSSASSWKDEFAEVFRSADVVIVQDLDKAGDGYRDAIGSSLAGVAKRCRVVWLPVEWRESHGLDVSDWLDTFGGTPEELQRLVEAAPEWREGMGRKPAESKIGNAASLLLQTFEPIRWVVDGILPEGIFLLAGKPKMGKSWLVLSLCVATATGNTALGKAKAVKGSVLYLALEDNARRFQSRLKKLLESEPPDADVRAFSYLTECPKVSDGGLLVIEDWLKAHPDARLVVVDTLAKIRPQRKKNADGYEEDYAAVQGLKQLADKYRVAVVLVHHLRKAGAEDPLDAISGTLGLSGGVDGALVMQRERGRADAFLYVSGRDIEEEIELALHWSQPTARWTVSGTAEEFRMSSEQAAVLQVLRESDEPMRPRDIWEALRVFEPQLSQHAVKFRIARMVKEGTIAQAGHGRYALPVDNSELPTKDARASTKTHWMDREREKGGTE